jgi:hypothetical protein
MVIPDFTPSKEEQRAQERLKELATNDLIQKLRYEASLKRGLRSLMDDIVDDFKKTYSATRVIIGANKYQDDLQNMIFKHMQKVARAFSSKLRMRTSKSTLHFMEYKIIDLEIDKQVDTFVIAASVEQAALITKTNQEDIGKALSQVNKQALLNGEVYSQAQTAKLAASNLKERLINRIDTIALTVTQLAAEKGKEIEARFITNTAYTKDYRFGDDVPQERPMIKEWVTVLDERTRLTHVVADGQRRPMDQAYLVGGDRLMYPGDYSLGAKPENTINCRCTSISYLAPADARESDFRLPYNAPGNSQGPLAKEVTDSKGRKWGYVRGLANTPARDEFNAIIPVKVWKDELARLKKEKKENIYMFYRHRNKDGEKPFGVFPVKEMTVTDEGLYVQGYIDLSKEEGRDMFNRVLNKEVTNFSVGTNPKELYEERYQYRMIKPVVGQPVGSTIRHAPEDDEIIVTRYHLYEVSLTPAGATPGSVLFPVE